MDKEQAVTVVFDANDDPAVLTAVELFANDIFNITGKYPHTSNSLEKVSGDVIVLGTFKNSLLIKQLNKQNKVHTVGLDGLWESYQYHLINNPNFDEGNVLVIAGSDARGAAYGLLDLSKQMGVSPWHFWADVNPTKQEQLSVQVSNHTSIPPSVKYRGIFINDEDWGLQPWAAKTLEPETGDIGPKTYAHVFELLLRLKANLIWPAMHPCTRGFFTYPENIKVAEKYGIVVGSSHCEQMLCNNVDEWKTPEFGPFNYFTNKNKVIDYWSKRVEQSKNIDGIYTLGLRGVHDSGIVGASGMAQKIEATNNVIKDQRRLLQNTIPKKVTEIPQVLIPYKEVLDIYDRGIELPEDITLIWPDDNYGYIRRLSNKNERMRSGGSGVYYHASYWGRPHDYLWLSSTNPWLIWEEMHKAYRYNARNVWVLNVGDIKPLEYNIDLFMDMAWDIEPYSSGKAVKNHMNQWCENIFGNENAILISDVKQQYYQLAFERRPEFMGWSQTEPTTQVHTSAYQHQSFNDEAQLRIDQYDALEKRVDSLYREDYSLSNRQAAFYQLVYYPVVCASNMNKKFIFNDKVHLHAAQGRKSVEDYAQMSQDAYDKIVKETNYYNDQLAGGKWRYIMSHQPRNLPVYKQLDFDLQTKSQASNWDIFVEGTSFDSTNTHLTLPEFFPWYQGAYFIDIYLKGKKSLDWKIKTDVPWIVLSKNNGELNDLSALREERIWVSIDWHKLESDGIEKGKLTIISEGMERTVYVEANKYTHLELDKFEGSIENNGFISIFAENYTEQSDNRYSHWLKLDGFGHTGASMQYMFATGNDHEKSSITPSSTLSYDFFIVHPGKALLTLMALPTHSISKNTELRISVTLDGNLLDTMNFQTKGRSSDWKKNVLSNTAKSSVQINHLAEGKHTLIITGIDPSVILDRILLKIGNNKEESYSVIPELRYKDLLKYNNN